MFVVTVEVQVGGGQGKTLPRTFQGLEMCVCVCVCVCIKDLFIYSLMRDTRREAETQAEGEAGSMQEPDVGLDPGTPGSCPGLKGDAQSLSHPGVPDQEFRPRLYFKFL